MSYFSHYPTIGTNWVYHIQQIQVMLRVKKKKRTYTKPCKGKGNIGRGCSGAGEQFHDGSMTQFIVCQIHSGHQNNGLLVLVRRGSPWMKMTNLV
jgi:hypothetical protein